jgi:hypothetical protein
VRARTLAVTLAAASALSGGADVQILKASGGLPAHIVAKFGEPIGYVEASNGEAIVLDRRAHVVYGINRARTAVRTLVNVGLEKGAVVAPGALAMADNDIFAIADAPQGMERIQYFSAAGMHLGGFYTQQKAMPRVTAGSLVLSGVGSLAFTGKTFLISRPESGALFAELDNSGAHVRWIGTARATGQERAADLHAALNAGFPLQAPGGGFFFVFATGVPKFHRYDAAGRFLYERHIEGIELDETIRGLPTTWRARGTGPDATLPFVPPVIRTAAVSRDGRLWVSLSVPFTYVYGPAGEKERTVQFEGAGVISPATMYFTKDGRLLVTPGCYEFTVNRPE